MNPGAKRRLVAGAAALAVVGGIALFNRLVVRSGPPVDAFLGTSAIVAIAVVAGIGAEWPRSRGHVVALSVAAALTSILATIAHTPREAPQDGLWIVAEVVALLTLLVLVVRWVPVRNAVIAGGLTAAAAMATMWRITVPSSPLDVLEVLGALLNWSFGVAIAVGFGMYLRALDARRARMVVDVRRAQRLELARDLHDFVAHDVTGMVVQAQAANVVARRDPEEAIAALGRIEEAGLRALGSLDHTVHMLGALRVPEGRSRTPSEEAERGLESRRFGLDDVLALVGRFAATDQRSIRLLVDTGPDPAIPSEVLSTAYRVILEALTNVRRHAPAAAQVDVSVTACECEGRPALAVRITNDASVDGRPVLAPDVGRARRSNRGLTALAAAVDEIGGTFAAGAPDPGGSSGWNVTAVLPLRRMTR